MSREAGRTFLRISRIYDKQRKIAENPEKAAKYGKFGRKSITMSVFTLIFSAGIPYLSAFLFKLGITDNLALIGNIICVVLAIGILILPFSLMPYSVAYGKAQRRLNDLKIGKTALILTIISITVGILLTAGLTVLFYSLLLG